ncbi:MAG: hypothetical protein V2I34_00335 [Bacteroidales bacterium]|jgi:hypothetical protein|nr:hypothetical protein [Bacteroidales bacterium]
MQKEYAQRISIIIEYLKNNKISQYEIEDRLNYTSLSKAKNFEKYPQTIIEKLSRKELYEKLLDEYGLDYDEKSGQVTPGDIKKSKDPDDEDQYFIMYYYAFLRDLIARARVRVINNKHAIIDYQYDEHWEGTYEIIENYTFISVQKQGEVTPVKKLICLFSGTKKIGRPFLIGTYSTVKRDGIPAAGKVLFERVGKNSINNNLKSQVDHRIANFLFNKVFVTETFTPNTLDDMPTGYWMIKKFASQFYLFYPNMKRELIRSELTCYENSRAVLIIKGMKYSGFMQPVDNHTLRIELSSKTGFSQLYSDNVILFINTNKANYDPFYLVNGISSALEQRHNSFSCMMIEKEIYKKPPDSKSEKILSKIIGMNSSSKL